MASFMESCIVDSAYCPAVEPYLEGGSIVHDQPWLHCVINIDVQLILTTTAASISCPAISIHEAILLSGFLMSAQDIHLFKLSVILRWVMSREVELYTGSDMYIPIWDPWFRIKAIVIGCLN